MARKRKPYNLNQWETFNQDGPLEEYKEETQEETKEPPKPKSIVYDCNIPGPQHIPIRIIGKDVKGKPITGDYKIRLKTYEEVERILRQANEADIISFLVFPDRRPLFKIVIHKGDLVDIKRIAYIGEP
jgi:hypothetical protein